MFKLMPACKDYLWGGHRLVDDFGINFDKDVCAEAWVLSCHKDGPSIVADGEHKGEYLSNLLSSHKELLGTNCKNYEDFPILIKLIDAKKSLSIQVHPDDEYALLNEKQYGKTEMWYILDANEGAFLYQGFEHEISRQEFEERIRNNTLTQVLNKLYVKKGDVVFIPPGTLHAIGEGILIAEIQQSSNVTYRIYDYGRLGADGKPRQLHIEQALEVTKLEKPLKYVSPNEHLVSCRFFDVDHYDISDENKVELKADEKSFVHMLVTEGEALVSSDEQKLEIKKGESLFIPAGTDKVSVIGKAEIIITRIP